MTYREAFETLKAAYTELDAENRRRFKQLFSENYHRVVQIRMTGRADGVLYVEFARENGEASFRVVPSDYVGADAYITASYDHLLGMANGTVSADKLFMTGQLKVEGNLAKSAEMRQLLGRA